VIKQDSPLRQALASNNFVRLWVAGLFAGVMRWLEILAVGIYTLEVTGSAFAVALMYFARTVPTLFAGPICGALAERVNRKRMYLLGVSVMLLLSTSLAGLAWLGILELWHIAVGAVISGVVWSLEHTVRRTIARDVVPTDAVGNAISLDTGTQNATRMLGPLIGGALMAVIGLEGAYSLGVVFYAISLVLIAMLVGVPASSPGVAQSFFPGLVSGFRHATENRLIGAVLVVTIVLNLFGFPYLSMVPVIGRDTLGLSPAGVGALMAAEGVGAVVGGVLLAVVVKRRYYTPIFAVGSVIFVTMMIVFSNTTTALTAASALVFAGIGLGCFAAMQSTILLTACAPAMRGRIMGILVVTIGAGPFGVLLLGALAERMGATDALSLTSSVGLGLLLLTLLRWRELLAPMPMQMPAPAPVSGADSGSDSRPKSS
jgi:MFS family permease